MKHECKTCHASFITRDPEDHIDICLRQQAKAEKSRLLH